MPMIELPPARGERALNELENYAVALLGQENNRSVRNLISSHIHHPQVSSHSHYGNLVIFFSVSFRTNWIKHLQLSFSNLHNFSDLNAFVTTM